MFVEDSIGLLREMVRIPSPSFEEGEVASLLERRLSAWGLDNVDRVGNNLLVRSADFQHSRPSLVMDAHIDTVTPPGGYSFDPFDPGDDPAMIRGLGSNDDGGSVVAMIAAFRHFYDKHLPVNLVLTLTSEEERSGAGGAAALFSKFRPNWAIIGEPTGMNVATSERGLLVLDCTARGVSGHAARGEGVNAIYMAMEDISVLTSIKLGDTRISVTQIEAGSAHNVIPDECRFVVDIRPTAAFTPVQILSQLKRQCHSEMVPRNLNNRSSASYDGSLLVKTARNLGMPTFASPTTSNWMRVGCDAVKMGPGDSSRSHHADEFIRSAEIHDAVKKYISFIDEFCNGYTME